MVWGMTQNGLPASVDALRREMEKQRLVDDCVHMTGSLARAILRDFDKLRDDRDLWRFRAQDRQEVSS